jgi:hypothetical protein
MRLEKDEVQLFFKLYQEGLLCHVALEAGLSRKRLTAEQLKVQFKAERIVQVRDQWIEHPEWLEAFVEENPLGFTAEELEIVRAWKHREHGRFYVLRHLKKHTVFFGGEPARAYGVLSLGDDLEDVLPSWMLPQMVEAVLLPFRGRIVYDGLMGVHAIHFGPGIRRGLNDEYQGLKAREGIITSLPVAEPEKRESDADQLRRYLRTERSRAEYAAEIQELIGKSRRLQEMYHREMGKVAARRYKRELRQKDFKAGWFAVLEGLLLGGAQTHAKLEAQLRPLLPKGKERWVHYFELGSK